MKLNNYLRKNYPIKGFVGEISSTEEIQPWGIFGMYGTTTYPNNNVFLLSLTGWNKLIQKQKSHAALFITYKQ